MDNGTKHINDVITNFMESHGMTLTEMAATLGMTTNTLNAKRRGDSDWRWSELLAMCKLFGMTPNELMGLS